MRTPASSARSPAKASSRVRRIAILAASLAACAHKPPASTASGTLCGEGLLPLGEACFAAPRGADETTPVVIYLHGMFPSDYPEQSLQAQRELAAVTTARGFALLVPRGRLGLCDFRPELRRWYCWPSTARAAPLAGEIALEWEPLWRALDDRLGKPDKPRRRFVLGYSNGGFFAALLAARGDVPFDGYAIAHAGPVEPAWFDPAGPAPVLLLSAEGQSPLMESLHARLGEAGWAHEYRVRPGPNALTDRDIEDALAFFAAQGR